MIRCQRPRPRAGAVLCGSAPTSDWPDLIDRRTDSQCVRYSSGVHVFQRWLRERFGTTPPAGYCLRTDHRERWLRLHSLPASKRYAEDDAERGEVRRRAWAAASEVLPTGSPVWLVMCMFGADSDHARRDEVPSLVFHRAGRYEHALLDEPLVAYAAETTWPHDGFDQLLAAIAGDAVGAVWFCQASGEVFAPYDGGVDLVVESPRRAEALRRVFAPDWFSSRADGL